MGYSALRSPGLITGAPAAVVLTRPDVHGDGADVGRVRFVGKDSGGAVQEYARFIGFAATDDAGSEAGEAQLWVADGSGALQESGTIDSAGHYVARGCVRSAVGSAASPGHSFTGDTGTGMYRSGAGEISFASSGVQAHIMDSAGALKSSTVSGAYHLRGAVGSVGAPTFAFTGYTSSGMYVEAGPTLSFAAGGVKSASITSAQLRHFSSGAVSTIAAQRTDEHGSAQAVGSFAFNGRNATPADTQYAYIRGYVLNNSATVPAAEIQFMTVAGAAISQKMAIGGGVMVGTATDPTDGHLAVQYEVLAGDGAVGGVAFGFRSDGTTGIFKGGTGQVNVACSGATIAYFDPQGVRVANGGESNPGLTFQSTELTGFYYISGHTIGVSGNSGKVGEWGLTGIMSIPAGHPIDGQDETDYDNSPATEGTFSGGTGHAALDVITLSDGTKVTVDAVSGGVVTEFTVDSVSATGAIRSEGGVRSGDTLTQTATTGSGVSFSLTLDDDNVDDVPQVRLDHTGVVIERTAATSDPLGYLRWIAPNAAFQQQVWGDLALAATAFGEGLEDSTFTFRTLENSAFVTALQVSGKGAYFLAGSSSVPSISFIGDPDTGLYSYNANAIGFAAGGSVIMTLNASALASASASFSAYINVGAGGVSGPTYAFTSAGQTGLYYEAGATAVGVSVSNSQKARINADGVLGFPGCYDDTQVLSSNSNTTDVNMRNGFITYQALTENTTYQTPTNPVDGQILTVILRQADGNAYTVAFSSAYLLVGDAFSMTQPSGHNAIDVIRFVYYASLASWIEISRTQDVY